MSEDKKVRRYKIKCTDCNNGVAGTVFNHRCYRCNGTTYLIVEEEEEEEPTEEVDDYDFVMSHYLMYPSSNED